MRWTVGIKIGGKLGYVTVSHPESPEGGEWDDAICHCVDMVESLYPKERVVFEWVNQEEDTST